MIKDKVIIALDVNTLKEEEKLLDILSPHVQVFKVGMELFYSCGTKAIDLVKKYDKDIFLDLKFHDIPNTVYAASKVAVRFGVFMFNVHASGGFDMMKKAVEGAEEESEKLGISRPKILGVTVLTSMDKEALAKIGINKSAEDQVLDLARLAEEAASSEALLYGAAPGSRGVTGGLAEWRSRGSEAEKLTQQMKARTTPAAKPRAQRNQQSNAQAA